MDLRDAQCALIRRRARRALAGALAVDPWVAERPSQARGPGLTLLQRSLQSSSHSCKCEQVQMLDLRAPRRQAICAPVMRRAMPACRPAACRQRA
eukprot:9185078-Pyramimonas_sp.AAC.1